MKEFTGGHGTRVAGIAAGKKSNQESNADGIASNAKIHVWDMKKGQNGNYFVHL